MTHKTTSTIVFEAMLAEAQDSVRKLVKRGVDKKAAARKVATEMDMTFDEAEALQQRVDTVDLPTPAEIATPASSNCITFATPTELEQAQGILMYKGVPWSSARDKQLVFDSKDTLNKAHDILKRRWDFVESANRKVAVIEFDNIGEFDRVIDFMRKQNMLMDFGVAGHDLSDDVLDEMKASQSKPEKGKKIKPISEDDIAPQDNSYVAVSKDKRDEEINVWDNVSQRTVKARKRWK